MCMTMMEMAAVLKLASDNYLKNGDEAGTCREKETFHIIAATLRTGCLLILDKERIEDSRKSILDQYDRAIAEIFEGNT